MKEPISLKWMRYPNRLHRLTVRRIDKTVWGTIDVRPNRTGGKWTLTFHPKKMATIIISTKCLDLDRARTLAVETLRKIPRKEDPVYAYRDPKYADVVWVLDTLIPPEDIEHAIP